MAKQWHLSDALGLSRLERLETWSYSVFVRNLVLSCSIGIYEHEKLKKQRVRVNADLTVVPQTVVTAEDIDDVLNYETIIEGVQAIADAGHIDLVETFADRVASLCLTDRRVESVRVSVEKLDVYPQAESVGVSIERRRKAPPRRDATRTPE
jgi:dihydroneopterin aldolase